LITPVSSCGMDSRGGADDRRDQHRFVVGQGRPSAAPHVS